MGRFCIFQCFLSLGIVDVHVLVVVVVVIVVTLDSGVYGKTNARYVRRQFNSMFDLPPTHWGCMLLRVTIVNRTCVQT